MNTGCLLRDALQSVLAQRSHQVPGHTSNPTRALADLQRLQPQPQVLVLVLDLNLGPRSGLELLDEVRRRGLAARALSMEPSLALLSAREQQVIRLVVLGHASISIGALLHLSPKTADAYRSRPMVKLPVPEVTALVRLEPAGRQRHAGCAPAYRPPRPRAA